MRAVDMIAIKRDGGRHEKADLAAFLGAYLRDEVGDEQVAAWLMAVVLRGMDDAETLALTEVLAESGERVDLSSLGPRTADKHSTGGVGDKTTLVTAPIMSAAGLVVAKLSGRGLGHTGGTIDKLESIPGLRTDLSTREFLELAARTGLVVAAQTSQLAPADGRLYALRDVTGTIESIPLIAASVMSKKLAAGANIIVLDVKAGRGAFMRTPDAARRLAELMVAIGRGASRKTTALITAMDRPLGQAVGNSVEIAEAAATLRGEGPGDLRELGLALAGEALFSAGLDSPSARALAALDSGRAYERLAAMVEAQGGDPRALEPGGLEIAEAVPLSSPARGHVQALDALAVGRAALALGAGRSRKSDPVDHAVGLTLLKRPGDPVALGQTLALLHHRNRRGLEEASALVGRAYTIGSEPPLASSPILDRIR